MFPFNLNEWRTAVCAGRQGGITQSVSDHRLSWTLPRMGDVSEVVVADKAIELLLGNHLISIVISRL
jgi:hypothetical protein